MRAIPLLLALALVAGAGRPASAQSYAPSDFPHLRVWAFPGAFMDSTLLYPNRCAERGPLADSIREVPRTITVRFLRDLRAERRRDFGGYRIYRVQDTPDTTYLVLLRRYSVQPGDANLWYFSRLDTLTGVLRCKNGSIAHDSVITFVDPDSNGALVKVCRRTDHLGRCLSLGDSVWRFVAPPGPHDGFRTWYTVTYEALNTTDNNYTDMFVPDTSDWSRCGIPGVSPTCPNLNNKALNMIPEPVEATGGPTRNLQQVAVVPNPYRAREAWDRPGGTELHFINLPSHAKILIYTVAGELVRELTHEDAVRDFERWDLKNASGRDVGSGIYMYRVTAANFAAQSRFIVIR